MDASKKNFVATRILVFDFELFRGGRCALVPRFALHLLSLCAKVKSLFLSIGPGGWARPSGLLRSVRVEACGSLPNGHDVGRGAGMAMDKCCWIEENEV